MNQFTEMDLMANDCIVRFDETGDRILKRSHSCSNIKKFNFEDFEQLLSNGKPLKLCSKPDDVVILQVMRVLDAFLVEYIRYGDFWV